MFLSHSRPHSYLSLFSLVCLPLSPFFFAFFILFNGSLILRFALSLILSHGFGLSLSLSQTCTRTHKIVIPPSFVLPLFFLAPSVPDSLSLSLSLMLLLSLSLSNLYTHSGNYHFPLFFASYILFKGSLFICLVFPISPFFSLFPST